MKRLILFLMVMLVVLPVLSQNIVSVWSSTVDYNSTQKSSQNYMIDANDVESVTYEKSGSDNLVVLYIKDGTTKQFEEYGATMSTDGRNCSMFFGNMQNLCYITKVPKYGMTWEEWNENVYYSNHEDNNYYVALAWWVPEMRVCPQRHGVCLGGKPGLTLEECDNVVEFDEEHKINETPYILVGSEKAFYYDKVHDMYDLGRLGNIDQLYNWLNLPLECGQTYYYRPFAVYSYESGGQEKEYICYGSEESFRIPKLKADFGYGTEPIVPDEVWKSFMGSHFDEKDNCKENWELLSKLFDEWLDYSQTDWTPYSLDVEFDDGIGYQIKQIPDEFYTWLMKREIVIRPTIASYRDQVMSDGEVIPLVVKRVTGVSEEWQIPNNEYLVVESSAPTINCEIQFTNLGIMPNVHYKVTIVFAPETREEMKDTHYMLPTQVRIGTPYQQFEFNGSNDVVIPATEVTTLVYNDYVSPSFDANNTLNIKTHVSATQLRTNTYSRIMHIGQIKLTPIE